MNAPSRSAVFAEIAEVIGVEAACKLVEALGGLRIYVPNEVPADHEIALAIGGAAAARLASFYHGTSIVLPVSGSRKRRVYEMARSGRYTRKQIAKATGYSERHVYDILQAEKDDNQDDLFGGKSGD
jgi:hypothetical protein